MALRHIPAAGQTADNEEMVKELVHAWQPDEAANEPLIITQGGTQAAPNHVYVIWEKWGYRSDRERSRIIMDAAERVYDRDSLLKITVAMGLTREEAKRLRMAEQLGLD